MNMEIFDIVDAQGNPTGERVERNRAHTEGIRHRTAHIWVLREREGRYQVLLQKRSQNKDSFPGRYDNKCVNILSKPGMLLQKLTTNEPDDDQIRVGIASVEAVFNWKKYLNENFGTDYELTPQDDPRESDDIYTIRDQLEDAS